MSALRNWFLGIAISIACIWVGYTAIFVGVVPPVESIPFGMVSLILLAYAIVDNPLWTEDVERSRNKRLAVGFQAHIWGLAVMYFFVGGYFSTKYFWLITIAVFLPFYMLRGPLWDLYIDHGWTKTFKQRLGGYVLQLAVVYGFYSAYYFDGPYCRTVGYVIAAGLTAVLTAIGIVKWVEEKGAAEERERRKRKEQKWREEQERREREVMEIDQKARERHSARGW